MGLSWATARDGGRTTISARGSIDLHSSDGLGDHLTELIDGGERCLIIDLTQVDFCDSSGLNVLIRAYKHAARQAGTFTVTGAYGRVDTVLRTTGLDRFLLQGDP